MSDIRNVVLLSHSGAGKTSLAETFLFNTKEITRLGKVEEGNTVSDYSPEEIEHKISLNLSLLHCHYNKTNPIRSNLYPTDGGRAPATDVSSTAGTSNRVKINILDVPGYADFIGETISGLTAAEAGILIIDAVSCIEVGTERAYNLLKEHQLPFFIFVNKLDKENTDFVRVVEIIQKEFGRGYLPLQYPLGKGGDFKQTIDILSSDIEKLFNEDKQKAEEWRKKIIEAAAESDDALLEKYLEESELSPEEIAQGLRKAIAERKLVPIFCGSVLKNISVDSLLKAIVDFCPSPQSSNDKPLKDSPFSGQIFKTISDPYVGQLSVFKVFSGELVSNSGFYNSSKKEKERIGQLYFLQGKEQKPTSKVEAGDLGAVAKLKNSDTGDSICDEKNPITFPQIEFPHPLISLALKPKLSKDEAKISDALTKLTRENPTFQISRDQQTKELIISGMGNLCLEIALSRLKREFKLEVEVGEPKIAYKETIISSTEVQGKYKRQSGGHGQYGDVWLKVEPMERGKGFEFVNKIVGGKIPRQYIPAVEKGIKQAMSEGVLAGYPLIDLKVTVYDGSFHSVDSSDLAFQIAAAMALRKGALEAKPALLEPIVEVEIDAPQEYMGDINSGLSSKRGRIMGLEGKKIKAIVPLAEMAHYAADLKSVTGGRGSFSMKFSHYEVVPQKISEKIIAQSKMQK